MKLTALLWCLTLTGALMAQKADIYNTKGIAVRGYDVVAYFTEAMPVKGTKEYQHQWNGAVWYFSNAEHLEKFIQTPEMYAPQYGGYCAYAVAQGSTAPTDPQAWTITNDKLYLNFNKSIHKKWQSNQSENIKKADMNWPGVLE